MYLLLTVYSMRRHTSKMHYKEDDLVPTKITSHLFNTTSAQRNARSPHFNFHHWFIKPLLWNSDRKRVVLVVSGQTECKNIFQQFFCFCDVWNVNNSLSYLKTLKITFTGFFLCLCFKPSFVSCRWNALYSLTASLNTRRRVRSNSTLSKFTGLFFQLHVSLWSLTVFKCLKTFLFIF